MVIFSFFLSLSFQFCWCHGNFKRSHKTRREGGKRSVLFSLCLLLGDLADGWGGRRGGNQKSTVHEAAPHQRRLMSWSYLQTPGRSAAALRLQAISVTDQMSERRYRPAAQIALVMCLKCKPRGNRNNMRSLLQQLFPFSLCDSSLKKKRWHLVSATKLHKKLHDF